MGAGKIIDWNNRVEMTEIFKNKIIDLSREITKKSGLEVKPDIGIVTLEEEAYKRSPAFFVSAKITLEDISSGETVSEDIIKSPIVERNMELAVKKYRQALYLNLKI